MGKENRTDSPAQIINAFKKAGIKCTRITINLNPQGKKDVRDYVMRIEEAHRKAAESELIFPSYLVSNSQP
ncbi:MAG: hypothetical protein Q7R31_03150 [Candidatus Levybacteria bacterium]|nr:hypothetical protein [Candidatus Levybacteria bacterium]